MEDSRKDNLGMEKMMNGDRIQSMKENEVKKVEIQQMLGSAKSNQGFPFVNLTMQVGVMIFGEGNIEQVVVWDQKTAQAVTFVLKSTLDRNAQPWLPQGRGQECKEDEVVEEEDKNTESTEVETMSYERLAEAVDKQKAEDDVEADCEKEKGDVSKAPEQNVLDKSEADEVETEDRRVQPIHYNGNGGVQAARRRAENIMFHQSLSCLVDSVVGYLVLREEDRKPAKEFLVDFSNKWFESLDSHMQTSECVSAANGWEDCCWASKDVYLELAEGVWTFKQKYFEDNPELPLTYKKMVGWMCKGFYITCTEMSDMCNGFAYAEENDRWKSWESSDEYLDVLTLRGRAGSQAMSISKC